MSEYEANEAAVGLATTAPAAGVDQFTQVSVSGWLAVGASKPLDASAVYVVGDQRLNGTLTLQTLVFQVNGVPSTAEVIANGETPGQLGLTGVLRVQDALGVGTAPTDDLTSVGQVVVRGGQGASVPLQLWQAGDKTPLAVVDAGGRLGVGTSALTARLTAQSTYSQPLQGTVAGQINLPTLVGTGTAFTSELRTGDWISIPAAGSGPFQVTVQSDTQLQLSPVPTANFTGATAYRDDTLLLSARNAHGDQQLSVGRWGDLTVAGSATVAGDVRVAGGATVAGGLAASGPASLGDTLSVTGAATLSSVKVSGAATAGNLTAGSLDVTGGTTLSGLTVSGTATTSGLNVTGAATISGLTVSGASTLSGLNVTGAATISGLNVTGVSSLSGLTVSGVATISGLNVTGASTLSGLTVSGAATLSAVTVSGNATVAGGLAVPGAPESLRQIRGNVYVLGSQIAGTGGQGFAVRRLDTGRYQVTFDQAFTDVPSASATQVYPSFSQGNQPGDTRDNAVIYGLTTQYLFIATGDSSGRLSDRSFTFLVSGPR